MGTPGSTALAIATRVGLSEPISTGGPSESDVSKTRDLEKFLVDAGLYESHDEAIKREEVLGRLDQIVKTWVKNVSRARGYNGSVIQEANAKIFTFGSYRLGVHGPGADIDTLCVGPKYATRNEDFFGELHRMLSEMPEVQELHPVPDAHVPVMRFKFNGASIDLLYANVSLWIIPEDLDISQESILQNVDDQTVRSLNGCRVTDQILRLVPNIQNFRTTLRCMRLWAKRRGVYSNVTGFLVARICQLYPNALPSMLVSRFFRVYNLWRWPNPVMLSPIQEGSLGLSFWDPRRNYKDRSHLMPIITPAYPCMNSSYNVSTSTLQVMMEEFHRGNEICEEIESNKLSWETLFDSFLFFEAYKNYLQIDIAAETDDDLMSWKGWVESRKRLLTLKIERDTNGVLQCHPHPGEISDKSKPFHHSYFMGLRRKQGANPQEAQQFDIRMTVEDFKCDVYAYSFWKPAMWIHVSHVKRKDLPIFAFPGGVRPSHPAKSFGSCTVRKSLASYPVQTDAAVSRKRRKLDEPNRGTSLTESSSNGAYTSDATSFDQKNLRKQIESDFSSPKSEEGVAGNLSLHTQGIPGLDQSECAAEPSDSAGAFPTPMAMEKLVTEQFSAQIPLIHQDSSGVFDGLEGLLKSETQNNAEAAGVTQPELFPDKRAVELAMAGNGTTSIIQFQAKEELEPLELAVSTAIASASAKVPAQKPLIRFSFTSLPKATGNSA
ncbi:Nuclear poly(A) polymerase 1 [Salvia divinorum]|uniref:polynucleotide adenylyltransferase n=1 Tax=Salvia divinorum TaxID=28513 RepID=A0ABD1HKL0_SALDI